jgi:hypothetical protein
MLRHLFFILTLTLVTGMATGIFGFFVTRDTSSLVKEVAEQPQDGFEILATVYGGCSRIGCTSLRIFDSGDYMYLMPQSDRTYERYEETLTRRQQEDLEDVVRSTDFEYLSTTVFQGTCPVTYDGIAYRYDIRYEDNQYSFDSCVHGLTDEPLFLELIKYLAIMETTYRTP